MEVSQSGEITPVLLLENFTCLKKKVRLHWYCSSLHKYFDKKKKKVFTSAKISTSPRLNLHTPTWHHACTDTHTYIYLFFLHCEEALQWQLSPRCFDSQKHFIFFVPKKSAKWQWQHNGLFFFNRTHTHARKHRARVSVWERITHTDLFIRLMDVSSSLTSSRRALLPFVPPSSAGDA